MMQIFSRMKNMHPQTFFFILMAVIYGSALVWTTVQSYIRPESGPDGRDKPIVIQPQQDLS